MSNSLQLEIDDATDRFAYIIGADHGYEVAALSRYDIRNVGTEGHLKHVLNDEQWTNLLDIINEALKKNMV